MYLIMKFMIFIILIWCFDFLLKIMIFHPFGADGIMSLFIRSIIATILAIISSYYILRRINDL
ncbi:hypothetical protein HMPREF1210_02641 [Paenisporosarcina sp. HGH0030]|uniref:hypothetical protein n=2 Tax=unclassified Paenisporosarcina TaxID=2642018 RepID=UPI00034E3057|nr:hypothetical protein [Paenisporosarcina sp. HGH0030]EPD50671.1 hypothetical protein HMPREF1210_02641 [Paenisporosarcina sp. HGH0030]